MDYRDYAKDLLCHRNEYINARDTLANEIDMLKSEKFSAKSAAVYCTDIGVGGSSKYEEYIVNLITLIDDAKFRRSIVERRLKQISSGLSVLDEYERELIDMFYIYNTKTPTEQLMKKYSKDRMTVEADKCQALNKFTRGVYGLLQM